MSANNARERGMWKSLVTMATSLQLAGIVWMHREKYALPTVSKLDTSCSSKYTEHSTPIKVSVGSTGAHGQLTLLAFCSLHVFPSLFLRTEMCHWGF